MIFKINRSSGDLKSNVHKFIDLSSTNVVPVHTELTGAYIGIGVAIVLLGITLYYFYGRKH